MWSQETTSPLGQVRSTSLRTVVGAIGLVAALVVSLAGPISYATVTYLERAEILSFKASVNASKLAKYIFAHGRLWQYQRVRLAEIIELPESTGEPIRQRVVDANAKVVLEEGAKLSGPLLRRQAPIFIEGNAVGRIEVEESLTPFLITLALISLVSLVLGSGAYVAFRVLPLKVLDRTLGQLNVQNERFDAALNNMSEGLCMFDGQQRLLVSNARYAQMYGLQPDQVKPGISLREICAKRISHGVYAGEIPEEYAGKLLSLVAQKEPSTQLQELSDGRVIAIKYQPMPVGGWVATHEDITEQRRIQERIAYMAHHDGLTDLPNRVLLREGLEAALHSERDTHDLAVLCLDLDRFKEINDTLGHATGDALLGVIAERLRSCVRDTDIVARIGGDEFAIVQIGGDQPKDATTLAARIIELTTCPVVINDQQMVVGTSIGIAIAPNDGTDTDQLLRNADLALYRAKTDGRGAYRFFEPEMDRRMQARRKLESDLRKALDNHEFELYYQPLVNLERDEICGFEALLRWNHPERGKVMPAEFIPLSEETGLIVPIGKWVLQQACAEAAGWPDHLKVAVNVSAVQFMNPGLANTIISALSTAGLTPNRLELEITEFSHAARRRCGLGNADAPS